MPREGLPGIGGGARASPCCEETDGAITPFVAEMAVDARMRKRGIGRALLDTCHALHPTTRIDLLAEDEAQAFYEAYGFRPAYQGMCRFWM